MTIEDASSEALWVALSEVGMRFEDFTEDEWRAQLEDEGYTGLRRTGYGFTNTPEIESGSQLANLWDLLADAARDE